MENFLLGYLYFVITVIFLLVFMVLVQKAAKGKRRKDEILEPLV